MSSLADILRAQFEMQEEDAFGKPTVPIEDRDRLVEISADVECSESDEETGEDGEGGNDEEARENESEEVTKIHVDPSNEANTVFLQKAAPPGENTGEAHDYGGNDECYFEDEDRGAEDPDEHDEYPFIDLDGGLAAIAESEGGGGESELEEECEFDYVGLASPQRAASSHGKRGTSSPNDNKNITEKSIHESLRGDGSDDEDDEEAVRDEVDNASVREVALEEEETRRMMRKSTSEAEEQDSNEAGEEAEGEAASPSSSIAHRHHIDENQSTTQDDDTQHDDKENVPSSSSDATEALHATSVSSSLRKSVSFASSLSTDAPLPLSPSARASVNSQPAPSTPPHTTFVQTVFASPEKLQPPDSPLSPVTPGKTERFGGGYFAEGSDHGVDAYLRLCYDMRTAPITKITTHAASLTAIDLEHRGIGNRGCVALSTFLRQNQSKLRCGGYACAVLTQGVDQNISRVNLGDNNLSAEGISAMMEAMATNNSVSELVLSGNNLSGCIGVVADAIANGQALRVLDVSSSKVGDEGVLLLAEAVRNSDLQSLNLNQNSISDTGFNALCATLDTNTSLKSLSLQWNGIKSMQSLAALLQLNSSLLAIDLTWNKIGSPGCVTLAKALSAELSPALLHLNISHNEIDAAACGAMARALHNNSKLKRLSLAGNLIGDGAALALLSGIGPTSPLLRLDLKGCGLGGRGGVPVEILAPEVRSKWEDQDNVCELRRVCPQLLGTLGPAPKAIKKKASGPKEWVGVRNVPEPRNMSMSQIIRRPGGTAAVGSGASSKVQAGKKAVVSSGAKPSTSVRK